MNAILSRILDKARDHAVLFGQGEVSYGMDSPDNERCNTCRNATFEKEGEEGICLRVAGGIVAEGGCKLYERNPTIPDDAPEDDNPADDNPAEDKPEGEGGDGDKPEEPMMDGGEKGEDDDDDDEHMDDDDDHKHTDDNPEEITIEQTGLTTVYNTSDKDKMADAWTIHGKKGAQKFAKSLMTRGNMRGFKIPLTRLAREINQLEKDFADKHNMEYVAACEKYGIN